MSELTGDPISKDQLNAWTAESREKWRFPLEYLPAFEVAVSKRIRSRVGSPIRAAARYWSERKRSTPSWASSNVQGRRRQAHQATQAGDGGNGVTSRMTYRRTKRNQPTPASSKQPVTCDRTPTVIVDELNGPNCIHASSPSVDIATATEPKRSIPLPSGDQSAGRSFRVLIGCWHSSCWLHRRTNAPFLFCASR